MDTIYAGLADLEFRSNVCYTDRECTQNSTGLIPNG